MSMKPHQALWGFLAAAGLLLGAPLAAQDDEPEDDTAAESEDVEVVIVRGIRGSMQQSLERKRQADHFVDAITAEDIGAFPDQNLAESLQRISGVAIDRKSGEGAFVSVRGLGPQFVQTTIGGRVSASNVAPGSHDGRGNSNPKSRAVGFHGFQSGLVHAVEIHKSPRADHVEGGLGGFVDIQPRKPFDLGERHIALSLDTTVNQLANDTAPGVFALFSDMLTERVGFMVSAQWDNRVFRSDQLHQNGYVRDPRTAVINGVEIGTGYYPNHLNAVLHTTDRDRLNISSSLQFRLSDRVDLTFDTLYASNVADEVEYLQSFRVSQGHARLTDATITDDNGTGIFTMISTSGAGAFIQHATETVDNVAANYGANLEIQATDKLALNFDVAVSDTEVPIQNRDALMRNTSTQMTYRQNGPGGVPSMTSTSPLTDVNHWSVVKHSIQEHLVDDVNTQFRADATYRFEEGWLDTAQVGVRAYRQERRDRARYLNSRAFIGRPITEFGGGLAFPADSDFLDGLGAEFPSPILLPNFDALQETFLSRADEIRDHPGGFNTGTGKSLDEYTSGRYAEDINHEDEGNALYGMITFSGDLNGTPYSGNLGVRYVDNSTGSEGQIVQPLTIDYSDPTVPDLILSMPEFLNVDHAYSEVLPSLNLRFDPRDDVVVRVALAKVFSRPAYRELNPNAGVQPNNRTMSGGNGQLDPTVGVQFDLALEWYFADYSIASLGVFTKKIEGFIQNDIELVPFSDVIDPDTNQPLVLEAFRPLNTGESSLVGLELAFQRTMEGLLPAPFDGLGVIANYTYINSGSDFESAKTMASYSIPGLSENPINFTVFYEKGPWTGRVAYNFRDDFLDNIGVAWAPHPYFVKPYEQFDASFGYAPNEQLSFALEAINLTDESVYYYNRVGSGLEDHFSSAINAGRRFQFGVRYKL